MASGDMKMKLLLNSKDFDEKLSKSKKNAKDLGKAGKAGADEFSAALGKAAAKVAGLVAAQATFDRAMKSSQGVARDYEIAMGTLNGVVDEFLSAIATADFSNFENGLSNLISRVNEYEQAARRAQEATAALGVASKIDETRYAELKAVAQDKNLPTSKRWQAYYSMRDEVIPGMEKDASTVYDTILEQAWSTLEKETNYHWKFTGKELDDALTATINRSSNEIEKVWENLQDNMPSPGDYMDEAKKLYGLENRVALSNREYNKVSKKAAELAEKARKDYVGGYDYAVAALEYALHVGMSKEELEDLKSNFSAAKDAVKRASDMKGELNGIRDSIGPNPTKTIFKAFSEAASAAWHGQEGISEETSKDLAAVMGVEYTPPPAPKPITNTITTLINQLRAIITTPSNQLTPAQLRAIEEEAARSAYISSMPISDFAGFTAPKVGKLPEKIEGIGNLYDNILMNNAEEYAKNMEVWQTSVDMLSGAFNTLGSSIGGATGEALAFVGALVDVAAQILPLIANLMAEKAAHDEVAGAAAREAASKAMSAYAGIPFAGIALGLGAVAAVIAAIKSASNIPKFADGGIVTSATLGVFGEAGPEAVLPLDKLKDYIGGNEVRVTGNIKASGKELAVVLDNYNRVRNG